MLKSKDVKKKYFSFLKLPSNLKDQDTDTLRQCPQPPYVAITSMTLCSRSWKSLSDWHLKLCVHRLTLGHQRNLAFSPQSLLLTTFGKDGTSFRSKAIIWKPERQTVKCLSRRMKQGKPKHDKYDGPMCLAHITGAFLFRNSHA